MPIGLSNARLAIPKVNRNPQPPKLGNAKPLATRIANKPKAPSAPARPLPGSQPSPALTQAAQNITNTNFSNPSVAGSTPGSTSAASTTPTAGPLPSSSSNPIFKIPTWTPVQPGEADPRDSTYWTNLAKLQFTDTNEYNKTLAEESSENSNYSLALQQAIRERGVQERQLGENAIKGNLGASGWLNRNQAEQATTYAEERGGASRTHEAHLQAFLAARNALQEGFGIEAAELLGEAAGRRAEQSGEETENGAPEVSEAGAPSPIAAALGYKPGSPGNKNNTKSQGIANNQKAGAGNNKGKSGAISNNQVAAGGKNNNKKKGK